MILRNCSFGDKSVQNHGLEKEIARAVTTDPFGCCSFEQTWYHSSFRGQRHGKPWFRRKKKAI